MTLDEIAIRQGTDKATAHTRTPAPAHGYTVHYERFFSPLRELPVKLLEVGVGGGESIRTWLEYFPQGKVYGVDNNPQSWQGPQDRFTFVLGDQGSEPFWQEFILNHGPDWDLVIDDGSHYGSHIINTFHCLWPYLKNGGLYAIEDLGVAYGGPPFTSPEVKNHMDFVKDKLDDINRGNEISWLHFSKELAILKKR